MANKQTIAELLVEIGVDAKEAEKASVRIEKKLKDVGKSGDKAGKGVDKANKSLEKFKKIGDAASKVANTIAAAVAAASAVVVGIGREVLMTGATFESLRAQLKTTTGTAEGAAKAFKFIQDFAARTPFQVDQVTEAFVKLNNFGIEPTEKVLTAFGDFASAFGKDFNQIIEAVTDATTGEFERLKEFGIKTSSEGDRVKLTFRGMTTEIGKNAKEIQDFLVGLAENNFGGAMAEQALTAKGLISNLSDTWSQFLDTVANLGPLEEFKLLIEDLSQAAGNRGGLAKQLGGVLTRAIRGVRRLLKGNLIPTLERLLTVVEFVINNIGKLAAVFAAGKLISGVSALSGALSGLGISITALTGPVGIAIAALAALGVAAVIVTNQINEIPKIPKAPGPVVDETLRRLAPETSGPLAAAQAELTALRTRVADNPALDIRANRDKEKGLLRKIDKLTDQSTKEQIVRSRLGSKRTEAEGERQRAALRGVQDLIVDPDQFFKSDEEKRDLDIAADIISAGGSGEDALNAIGDAAAELEISKPERERKKGRKKAKPKPKKKKKEKEEKQINPPTTVSEFFGAAARGELGPIADRTPSTQSIEPTVAVDITNNNFSFRDTFNITGAMDPEQTGKSVIKQIRAEFDRRNKNAGQTLATNMVR